MCYGSEWRVMLFLKCISYVNVRDEQMGNNTYALCKNWFVNNLSKNKGAGHEKLVDRNINNAIITNKC